MVLKQLAINAPEIFIEVLVRVESEITYHFERQSRHLDSVARWLNTLGIRPPRALSKCLLVTQNNNLFLTLP